MKKIILTLIVFCLAAQTGFARQKDSPPQSENQKVFEFVLGQSLKTGASKKKFFPEMASPFVMDGRIYVGTHSSYFYAVDGGTGKVVWQYKSTGPIASQAAGDGNRVYFGNNKGTVTALDSSSGQKIWEVFLGGEILAHPTLYAGKLFVVTTSREIYCLELSSGQTLWSTFVKGFENKFTMRGNGALVADDGHLYVGFADGQIASLNADNGAVSWSQNYSQEHGAPFLDIDADIIANGSGLYVVGYFGSIMKVSKDSGKVIWEKDLKSGAAMTLDGNDLYLTTVDGHIVAIDANSGTRSWDLPLFAGTLSPPAVIGSYVVVGAKDGRIYIFDLANHHLLQTMPVTNGFFGPAVVSGNRVTFLSSGGKLTAIALKK